MVCDDVFCDDDCCNFAKIGLGFVYDKLSVKTAKCCGMGVLDYILLIAFTQGKWSSFRLLCLER